MTKKPVLNVDERMVNVKATYRKDTVAGLRHRELGGGVTLTTGLWTDTEISISQSYRMKEVEGVDDGGIYSDSADGPGNLGLQLRYLLHEETGGWPALVGNVAVETPTGDGLGIGDNGRLSARDDWAVSTGLEWYLSYDYLRIHGGMDVVYTIADDDSQGLPGTSLGYNVGMAWAVNSKVTLLAGFEGGYQWAGSADNPATVFAREPMTLYGGVQWGLDGDASVGFRIDSGQNVDAPGVAWSIQFSKIF